MVGCAGRRTSRCGLRQRLHVRRRAAIHRRQRGLGNIHRSRTDRVARHIHRRYSRRAVRAQLTRSLSVLGSAENLAAEETIGWLRAVVVDPAVRGQGIGDQSVKAALEFFRQKRCRTAYAASWVSGIGQESDGMLTRNGFTSLGVISNYWSAVVDYRGFCAVCGKPCRCSAIIMRKSIAFTAGDALDPGGETNIV